MKSSRIVGILATPFFFLGCSSDAFAPPNQTGEQQATKPTASFSHVVTVETDYYTTGPQQRRPPDGKFLAGTKVNIIQQAGSHTLIRSEGGVEAYVASDAIRETEP